MIAQQTQKQQRQQQQHQITTKYTPTAHHMLSVICVVFGVFCLTLQICTLFVSAQPTSSLNIFPTSSVVEKLEETNERLRNKESAEQSFHQFINSKPNDESTIIGEIKPNATALELVLLRNKIANTISTMQELDKQDALTSSSSSSSQLRGGTSINSISERPLASAECYIEVTRVEKVPGKCHRGSSGIPICQSDNYMTISSECN